jgi:hypothetical protein
MPQSWSTRRERQYEHITESEKEEGRSTRRANEIAARTVNKQRAQSGETTTSSSRGGGSSSRGGGRTKEQLYNEAKRLGIEGRSPMNKEQLRRAVSRKK